MDSYRALVLRPDWEKAYYRCAESWVQLGCLHMALSINSSGCENCQEKSELERQQGEIVAAITAQGRYNALPLPLPLLSFPPLLPY